MASKYKQEGFNARMNNEFFTDNPWAKVKGHDIQQQNWDIGWWMANEYIGKKGDYGYSVPMGLSEFVRAYELTKAYDMVHQDAIGKILAERDLYNAPLPSWWKWLTKYRKAQFEWKYLRIGLYAFQEKRWEAGINYDMNGDPLLSINLICLHIEFEFIKPEDDTGTI